MNTNTATISIALNNTAEIIRKVVINLAAETESLDTVTSEAEVKFILVPKIILGNPVSEYENMPAEVVQIITIPLTTEDILADTQLNVTLIKDGINIDENNYEVSGATIDNDGKANIKIYAGPEITLGTYLARVEYQYGEGTEKVQAQKEFAITKIEMNQITIDQSAVVMEVGEKTLITYNIIPSSYTDKDLQFISENKKVVTIEPGGVITAVGRGETNVKIMSLDGKLQASCPVTVLQPTIEILEVITEPETLIQEEDGVINVKLAVRDFASGKRLDVEIYKGSQDVTGKFTIQGNTVQSSEVNVIIKPNKEIVTSGDYTFIVSYDGKQIEDENLVKQTATFTIKTAIPVTGIELEDKIIRMTVNSTRQIKAKIIPDNAVNKNMRFTTDTPNVAVVNEQGQIQALEKGIAIITVYSDENPEFNKTIEVRVIELVESAEYTVDLENKIIKYIPVNTTVTFLLENMQIASENYCVTDKNNKIIEGDTLIGTDYQLKIDEEIFKLVVIGDLNGDGKVSLTDLSKLKLHMVELQLVTGNSLIAADMNRDEKVTLTDISRMANYIVGIY